MVGMGLYLYFVYIQGGSTNLAPLLRATLYRAVTDGVGNPLPHLHDVSEHGRSTPAGALLVAVAPGAEDALQLPHPLRGQAHQRGAQVSLNRSNSQAEQGKIF